MPDKYIKVADLKKKLNYVFRTYGTSKPIKEEVNKAIGKIPYVVKGDLETALESVDVQPVKCGEWTKIEGCYYSSTKDGGGLVRKCSLCGEPSPCGYGTPYCAICGARMDGGTSDYKE